MKFLQMLIEVIIEVRELQRSTVFKYTILE